VIDGLQTRRGVIPFPAYIPVTTFGEKYPLDDLIRPYLPRLAPAVMVSLHYARQMKERPRLPLLIDSGGFAALFRDAHIVDEGGLGVIERRTTVGDVERTHPLEVLEFQEEHADVAFTLDFPIPPSTEPAEARRRLDLTVANAHWALENRRRKDLPLFACVQAWDAASARECAAQLATGAFDGFAIGGLVPRSRNGELVFSIVDAVREVVSDRPIHAFGLGHPVMVAALFERGVQSVDSSSYVRLAASGRTWSSHASAVSDPAPHERMRLAIENLAAAGRARLPLAVRSSTARIPTGSAS